MIIIYNFIYNFIQLYISYFQYYTMSSPIDFFQCEKNDIQPIMEQITNEHAHTCVFLPITRRPLCMNCIITEEVRVYASDYHARKHSHMNPCECDQQKDSTTLICEVCEGVKNEIKHIQSEIVRESSNFGIQTSQTFIINPMFTQTIDRLAFRCRMLNEFLLRQSIHMENVPADSDLIDVTDDISALSGFDDDESLYDESLYDEEEEVDEEELYNYDIHLPNIDVSHENVPSEINDSSIGENSGFYFNFTEDDNSLNSRHAAVHPISIVELDLETASENSWYSWHAAAHAMTLSELNVETNPSKKRVDYPMTLSELNVEPSSKNDVDYPMTLSELNVEPSSKNDVDYPMTLSELNVETPHSKNAFIDDYEILVVE